MERPPIKRRATYQDVIDAPEYKIAEIIDGELHLSPRPGGPATAVGSVLDRILEPFDDDGDGPGGWMILFEPELHLADEVLVPDLAAWRVERLPTVPEGAAFKVPPDWICEVLSKSTEKIDRNQKMAIYARFGIAHAWLIQPRRRVLEAYELREGAWAPIAVHRDNVRVRIPPFDGELNLARLWKRVPPITRASEVGDLGP